MTSMENKSKSKLQNVNDHLECPETLKLLKSLMKIDSNFIQRQRREDNKISLFGKQNDIHIDVCKVNVNLSDPEDQEILKRDIKKPKEIQFIDRAVRSLKFFEDKKQQMTEKLYQKLLEQLKYEFIEKEKPLFLHGDKGDKYFIVLKGELVLLLPPNAYEEAKYIDPLLINRLKERYYRMKDQEQFSKQQKEQEGSSNDLKNQSSTPSLKPQHSETRRDSIKNSDIIIQSQQSSRSNTPSRMAQLIHNKIQIPLRLSSAFKIKPKKDASCSSSQISSPLTQLASGTKINIGTQNLIVYFQIIKITEGLKPADFEAEKEQNTFNAYCSAFFSSFRQSAVFNQGAAFGEIALIRKTERTGTVVAKEDSHLMVLDKNSFDEVLGYWERQISDQKVEFLKSFPFFKELNEKYLLGMLHSLLIKQMVRGDIVCDENDPPAYAYLVREGEVELSKSCQIQRKETIEDQLKETTIQEFTRKQSKGITRVRLSVLGKGCYFGEDQLILEDEKIGFRAQIYSTKAEVWFVDKKNFYSYLKQQKIFDDFQKYSLENQKIRLEKIQSLIRIISAEEGNLKVTRFNPQREKVDQREIHSIKHLEKLITTVEEELENDTKPKCNTKSSIYFNNSKNCSDFYLGKQIISKEYSTSIDKANVKNKSEDYEQQNQISGKILRLFSRSNVLETVERTKQNKQLILQEISKNDSPLREELDQIQSYSNHVNSSSNNNHNNNNNSKPHPYLPFQKNLIFQPKLGNGIKKEYMQDPFKPCESPNIKSFRNTYSTNRSSVQSPQTQQRKEALDQSTKQASNILHQSQIKDKFTSIIKPKKFSSPNLITDQKRTKEVIQELIDEKEDYDFMNHQRNSNLTSYISNEQSYIPYSNHNTFSGSLPSLVIVPQKKQKEEDFHQYGISKQALESISERQQSKLVGQSDGDFYFGQRYHKGRNQTFIGHLSAFSKENYSNDTKRKVSCSTLNLNASEMAFDSLKVLSQETDFSEDEQFTYTQRREQLSAHEIPIIDSKRNIIQNKKDHPFLSQRQNTSKQSLRYKSPLNIHMEKRRLLKSSKNSISSNMKQYQKTKASDLLNSKEQQISLTENSFLDRTSSSKCIGSFFQPRIQTCSHILQTSRRKKNFKQQNSSIDKAKQ